MSTFRGYYWTRIPILFVVIMALSIASISHGEATSEERPANSYFPTVVQRDVALWSDGTRLSGVLSYPKNRKKDEKLPAIVLCHGWGGTMDSLIQSIAPRFASVGYVVLAFDYRGWGDSDSRLVVRSKMPKPDRNGNVTVTAQAIRELVDPFDQQEDIDAAISYIHGEPMVDRDRIGIWGTSFGGGHVIYRAAHDRRIACVVSQVPSQLDDGVKQFSPAAMEWINGVKSARARGLVDPVPQEESRKGDLRGTPHHERMALFNAGQYAGRVNVPTLLIDVEKEHYQDITRNGGRVHEVLKERGVPTDYHVLEGIGHYDIYHGQHLKDAMALEIPWFDTYLKDKK